MKIEIENKPVASMPFADLSVGSFFIQSPDSEIFYIKIYASQANGYNAVNLDGVLSEFDDLDTTIDVTPDCKLVYTRSQPNA